MRSHRPYKIPNPPFTPSHPLSHIFLSTNNNPPIIDMKTTPTFSLDDDFSFYFSFLQDSSTGDVDVLMPSTTNKRSAAAGGGVADVDPKRKKSRSIARLLTSLAALDSPSDLSTSSSSDNDDLSLLRHNHHLKSQTLLNHHSRLTSHYDSLESSSASLLSSLSAAAAAAASAAAEEVGVTVTASAAAAAAHIPRRLWVKDRSHAWWDLCSSPEFPEAEFRRAFRMSRATFDLICDRLSSAVSKEDTMLRPAIPVRQRVAVCIWRLATGEPLRLVSKRFGLGISTCHKLVLEVCAAIKSLLMPQFLNWPSSSSAVKSKFQSKFGVPNIIGSMYTTHVPIIAPKVNVAAYFNRRHTERNQKTSYSITVQGVVDADGVFTDVCIGWPGSMPDDQVLDKSALCQRAAAGMLDGAWIVGGSGYPLTDWVLVPYTHSNLTWAQHAFNEKIADVRGAAREAFARLKGRWGCLQRRTEVKLQDLPVVLGACCVLHNICEMRKEEMDVDQMGYELVDDEMMPEQSIQSVAAMQARDRIAHDLLHHGHAGTAFF